MYLDDERLPKQSYNVDNFDHIIIVRTAKEFCWLIENLSTDQYDYISFDHDIQSYANDGKEITGYDLLKWYLEVCIAKNIQPKTCLFHTANPVGRRNMSEYYRNAKERIFGQT